MNGNIRRIAMHPAQQANNNGQHAAVGNAHALEEGQHGIDHTATLSDTP